MIAGFNTAGLAQEIRCGNGDGDSLCPCSSHTSQRSNLALDPGSVELRPKSLQGHLAGNLGTTQSLSPWPPVFHTHQFYMFISPGTLRFTGILLSTPGCLHSTLQLSCAVVLCLFYYIVTVLTSLLLID